MISHPHRLVSRPRILGVALLLAGLLSGPLAPGSAHAAYSACRSDPIVVVNGMTTDIVSILQPPSATVIRELDYTITVPSGSLIGQTTLTVGLGFPEKVNYVFSAQQPKGALRVDASVVTTAGTAPFSVTLLSTTLLGTSQSVSGSSASVLTVTTGALLSL